ncbi:PAS domain-containing protein [Rhizobium sp. Leaf341]|uniref:PAS domain-containing protein n=1 Tax=Rhizobium sp. Leaf341 TaxID=1736344 RepID=UPI0007163A8D|nr:PAS domain-containing protein [Rhizobium sp. Leaf341]KQR69945.1 hypothetical protein ASG03_04590 [Rhizobium sp. Leaf341]
MPTTRLMHFSTVGDGEEAGDDRGTRGFPSLQGVSSTHFLKLIEDRGQNGFWTLHFDTGTMTTSVGLYRLFGIDPTIPLGREDLWRIMHPDDRPSHSDIYQTLLSGHAIDREFRIIRPDGTLRWLQNKAEVIVDPQGRAIRAVGVMMDVTDHHAARQTVEEGWHRRKTGIKTLAALEFTMAPDGDILSSEGWAELTGQAEAEACGRGWLDAIHPDDVERTRSWSASSRVNGADPAVDCRLRCADGEYRWFLARSAPILHSDGTISGCVGALFERPADRAGTDDRPEHTVTCPKASHIRAARALLDWTIEDLACKAGVSVSSVSRLEGPAGNTVRDHVLRSVVRAFEGEGISFTSGPQGTLSLQHAPFTPVLVDVVAQTRSLRKL